MKHFDVLVVGGGHAGVEAADAAARMGARVALVTLKRAAIGVMSCNPAIGGLGKGHLVREIDALGGVMGEAADAAGIQFRLLNRSKGPAVQGPRAQTDRAEYRAAIQKRMAEHPGIFILEDEVVDLKIENARVVGAVLHAAGVVDCTALILTTGTFLGGVIHMGAERRPAGRIGEAPSQRLAARLRDFVPGIGRLKTGTPPRLDGRTINWERLETQPGDEKPTFFSFLTDEVALRQVACAITHTNTRTHDIIRKNLGQSAVYGGEISGVGPRYCPSIEDKVVRFTEKPSHQIFLEPEGLSDNTVYPNGISTSLPPDIQEAYVRSIAGLEGVRILQPGYAIEYDFVDPRALSSDLGVRGVEGLYLAGQINGTTGYEEAAGQGLVAGINAARSARGETALRFPRSESYLGVMIDDLVTRGVSEPYRMFTSRAEYRLTLRADNADQRLSPRARSLGLLGADRWERFEEKMTVLEAGRTILRSVSATPSALRRAGVSVKLDGRRRTAFELLSEKAMSWAAIESIFPDVSRCPPEVRDQLKTEATYENYAARQDEDVAALRRDEGVSLPIDLDYSAISGLSAELREKLERTRPETLAQASRIEGMTPAACTLILAAAGGGPARKRSA